jgi:MFS family permease
MTPAEPAATAGDAEAEGLRRAPPRGTFASLSLPQFRFLLVGTVCSQIAGWMEEVARGWLVLQLTDSAFQLGLIGFIRGVTQLVFSPVAGAMADRLDRRQLAAATQLVDAVVVLVIGLLVAADAIQMWQLYVLTSVAGAAHAANMPARQVLVYDLVGPSHLSNAIALNSVVSNLARIVAPAVGGVFIGITGIASTYYAQAVFFALATAATLMLRPITHAEPVRSPLFEGIRDGIRYVNQDRTVLRLVVMNAIPNLIIYPYVTMMPVFAEDVLDVGSAGFGVLLTGVGFGSIPGGLIVAGMGDGPGKGRTMALAAVGYMSMVFLFALSTVFLLSFAILIVAGIGWCMMVTLNQTLLQIHVADAYRGRVLSLYTMVGGLTPFGVLAMGAAADTVGAQVAVAAFALTGAALAAFVGLASPRIRRL